jgi:hypothetical protein
MQSLGFFDIQSKKWCVNEKLPVKNESHRNLSTTKAGEQNPLVVGRSRFLLCSITDSMCLPSRIRHGQSSLFWRNRVWFCSLAVELLGLMMDAIGEQAQTV